MKTSIAVTFCAVALVSAPTWDGELQGGMPVFGRVFEDAEGQAYAMASRQGGVLRRSSAPDLFSCRVFSILL